MFAWLAENIGTIGVVLILAVIVFLIVFKLVKNKNQGKSTCGGNCAHCALHGSCHTK